MSNSNNIKDFDIVKKLTEEKNLSDSELYELLSNNKYDSALFLNADKVRRKSYDDKVYIRGLIEFTNYCKNNCYYCGIRCGNSDVIRYRLTKAEILNCCSEGYTLGFRTFVLQGGEDPYYSDEIICDIVSEIKARFPDCAVTLSIGEKSRESYEKYFKAGADRYLLRHETAQEEHYGKLHPKNMLLASRMKCLLDLKEIGFQVGAGFMVGSPYQNIENIICDLRFLQKLKPDMIGIGPFISHKATPFKDFKNGGLELTLRLISVLRLMFPTALIPSTTALGTISPEGRELGLKAGASVVMPNLSPKSVREKYSLYDNKICTGEEAAQCIRCLENRVRNAGYRIVVDIGNAKR